METQGGTNSDSFGQGQSQRRGMGAAGRPRRLLPDRRGARLGRSGFHPYLGPRSGRRPSLPDQSLRPHVRRGDRLEPGQGRPPGREGHGQRVRRQSGGLRDPLGDPRRPHGRPMRPPPPHQRGRCGLVPEGRAPADLAAVDLCAGKRRVPQLRRGRAERGGEAAARLGLRPQHVSHPAQSWAPDGRARRSPTPTSPCSRFSGLARFRSWRSPAAGR